MNVVHIHPMLIHFSIVLTIGGFLYDLYFFYYRKEKNWTKSTGFYIMLLCALAIAVAGLTGKLFSRSYDGVGRDIKNTHELFAIVTYVFFGLAFLIRMLCTYISIKRPAAPAYKHVYMLFYLLSVLAILYCSYLGGLLVYDYASDLRVVQH